MSKEVKCNNSCSEHYEEEFLTNKVNPVNKDAIRTYVPRTYVPEQPLDEDNNALIKVHHTKGTNVVENARDRFANLLNSSNADTFECIITEYIHKFGDTIPADECCQVIELLSSILYPKIAHLAHIKRVSNEHAGYLEKYLSGKLYKEDNLEKYRYIQRNNAQAIIDVCNE